MCFEKGIGANVIEREKASRRAAHVFSLPKLYSHTY